MLNIKSNIKKGAFAPFSLPLSALLIAGLALPASCQNSDNKAAPSTLGAPAKHENASSKQETSTDGGIKIDWPQGWQRQELDGLEMGPDGPLGKRIRALKKVSTRLVAIEFATIPRTDNGQAELAEECKIMERTVKDSYAAKKMEANVSPAKEASLGGLPAQEVEIQVSTDPQLKQRIIMALGKDTLYSMSYSALKDDYDSQVAEFERVLKSMTLK